MPHRLVHKGDRNDLRAVNGTPTAVVEDEPLTPTMTKGMEKRLQKIEDVGASGRRLIVGCDGSSLLAEKSYTTELLISADRHLGQQR